MSQTQRSTPTDQETTAAVEIDPIASTLELVARQLPNRLPGPAGFWTVTTRRPSPTTPTGSIHIDHRWFNDATTIVIDSHPADSHDAGSDTDGVRYSVSYSTPTSIVFDSRDAQHLGDAVTTTRALIADRLLPDAAPTGLTTLTRLFA